MTIIRLLHGYLITCLFWGYKMSWIIIWAIDYSINRENECFLKPFLAVFIHVIQL